jgi:predicted esterase
MTDIIDKYFAYRILLMTLFLGLGGCCAFAETSKFIKEVQCIGPETASHHAIFFHGIYETNGRTPEQTYGNVLRQVAKKEKIRIAMPISGFQCIGKKGSYCWGTEDDASVQTIFRESVAASAKCFAGASPTGFIGFSNGGYFVGRLMLRCLTKAQNWLVAMGSAGSMDFRVQDDLSGCGNMNLLIGKRDLSLKKAERFHQGLVAQKAKTTFQTWNGGHDVPERELAKIINGESRAE